MYTCAIVKRNVEAELLMRPSSPFQPEVNVETSGTIHPFQTPTLVQTFDRRSCRQLVSTRELSEIWGIPESTLRYWRSGETRSTVREIRRENQV